MGLTLWSSVSVKAMVPLPVDGARRQSMSGFGLSQYRRSYRRRIPHARAQALMRPPLVVIRDPLNEDRPQMRRRYRNQPVQALPPDRMDSLFKPPFSMIRVIS